jgi:hypothetical protein
MNKEKGRKVIKVKLSIQDTYVEWIRAEMYCVSCFMQQQCVTCKTVIKWNNIQVHWDSYLLSAQLVWGNRISIWIKGLHSYCSFSLQRPERLWCPPRLLTNGYMGLFPWGLSGRGVKLTTHLQLVSRSRMHGAIPPLSQYVFMAFCLVTTGTTLPFYYDILTPIKRATLMLHRSRE